VRRALGLTLLLTLALPIPAKAQPERRVLVFLMAVGSEEALAEPILRSISVRGGVGLMTETDPTAEVLADLRSIEGVSVLRHKPSHVFRELVALIPSAINPDAPNRELLVLAFSPPRPTDYGAPVPLFMGRGKAGELLRNPGSPPGLTSTTTRRPGVISNIDLGPTILQFLGEPIPEDLPGSPIRVEGEAPTELHQRFLEYRRVVVPVGVTVLLLTLAALAAALVLLLTGRGSSAVVRAAAVWGVIGVSLQVAFLPGSWLPTFEPAVVALAVGGIGMAVAVLALLWGRRSAPRVPAAVAGIGHGFVAVDAVLGWRSLLTPLLGGSALDGVRFYGLGNPYAGVVLAGGVLLAAMLSPFAGVGLLVATALFAGLPFLGADLGGGVTLFAVAGLWYGMRVRRGAWWAVGGAVLAGMAGAILLAVAHRFLAPAPTHVTRAVEDADGLLGILGTFLGRLSLNLEVTAATPAIWPALAGIPVALWVAVVRPGPFREPLERFETWRLGAICLALGGMLGYVLNDTYGMASVSFIYLALALVYPALAVRWTRG
jgi:hypothetical protein